MLTSVLLSFSVVLSSAVMSPTQDGIRSLVISRLDSAVPQCTLHIVGMAYSDICK